MLYHFFLAAYCLQSRMAVNRITQKTLMPITITYITELWLPAGAVAVDSMTGVVPEGGVSKLFGTEGVGSIISGTEGRVSI